MRHHVALAQELANWIRADERFELVAPVPFGTVCFRATPPGSAEFQDSFNEKLLARANAAGPVLISHTKLRERYTIRLAIGNLRTQREHIETAWRLVRESYEALANNSSDAKQPQLSRH
jgi:aromatic-L-amino-acid decarboxylase